MAEFKEYKVASTQQGNELHTLVWAPEAPKAVVQISHGMVEHIERYDEFARWLNEKGIAVVGHSHLGHGKSAASDKDLGFFGEKNGWKCVVADIHEVRKFAQGLFPGLPHILLGHSMGSFVARCYISNPEYAEGLAGAVISGTANMPGGVVSAGSGVASLIAAFCGKRHRSKMLNNMSFGSYNSRIENKRTEFDWLSYNEESVDAYCADPHCGYLFTTQAWRDMFSGLSFIADLNNVKTIRKDLPILFIAGDEDPCGAYGEGPKSVAKSYTDAGIERVELKLYPKMRHEVLNELERATVYEDVLSFVNSLV